MHWLGAQDDPLHFAKPLHDSRIGSYRFRIGNYRVLVEWHPVRLHTLLVVAIRHRSKAYLSYRVRRSRRCIASPKLAVSMECHGAVTCIPIHRQ
jgi:hypothetical protein